LTGEMADRLGHLQAAAESPRRFTGSQGAGYFSGNGFPIVGESIQYLELDQWRLSVSGAVSRPLMLNYAKFFEHRRQDQASNLDCTNGWYTLQNWEGVPLSDLLIEAGAFSTAAGVRLISATGYSHTYWMSEVQQIILATHVTGEVLLPQHGFPLRAVVPGRRGWFWVKWLTAVMVLERPEEVLAGIATSPAEVLGQWQ
jgi:DMSO/TMAO reductase YedYZ molybdopterin-dependent catalytic subunit